MTSRLWIYDSHLTRREPILLSRRQPLQRFTIREISTRLFQKINTKSFHFLFLFQVWTKSLALWTPADPLRETHWLLQRPQNLDGTKFRMNSEFM